MPSLTFGTSATQLDPSTSPVNSGVLVKAAAANAGTVYVGYSLSVTAGTEATTDGVELSAGEALFVPRLKASSPSGVYVIASQASQKVYWEAM